MSDLLVYCMKCRMKVKPSGSMREVTYTTTRGIKYGLVGFCEQGHKISCMKKKPENV